ncbi:unnamed protein product [Calypogeia fissa]
MEPRDGRERRRGRESAEAGEVSCSDRDGENDGRSRRLWSGIDADMLGSSEGWWAVQNATEFWVGSLSSIAFRWCRNCICSQRGSIACNSAGFSEAGNDEVGALRVA